jgi:hypothetical protein
MMMSFDADILDTPFKEANPQLHSMLEAVRFDIARRYLRESSASPAGVTALFLRL